MRIHLFLLFVLYTSKYTTAESLIDGKLLQLELQKVADGGLGVSAMQNVYDGLSYNFNKIDGKSFLDKISTTMSQHFHRTLLALDKLKDAVETNYQSFTDSPSADLEECCRATGTTYNTRFRSNVRFSATCYAKSSNLDPGAKYPPAAVEEAMIQNYEDNSNLLWQYFASDTGTYVNYPSVKLSNCDYDARFRPFYASGTSSMSKDVVITMDTSNSMGGDLMRIAKQAAITVVRTLNPNDRVGVVSFNDVAQTAQVSMSTCFSNQLAIGTDENTREIIEYINGLGTKGGTNYEAALRKSFRYFTDSPTSIQGEEREKVILFLTDGETEAGENPLTVIRDENHALNNSVVILTYGLGSELDSAAQTLLRNMSKQVLNDKKYGEVQPGRFEHITDPSNLMTAMGSYYSFFSTHQLAATFTVPYKDLFSDIGLLISLCRPANSNGQFIGVVCTDVKISDLQSEMGIMEEDETSYSFLTDGYGRTLIHPLLPKPKTNEETAVLIDVGHFETSLRNTDVIDLMKSGQNGERSILATRTLSRGEVLHEGISTRVIMSHYHWTKIQYTNYSICVVVGNEDTNNTAHPILGSDDMFVYHRRSLSTDNLANCRHFARFATKEKTLVMLTPSAFKEPYKYLDIDETEVTVSRYEDYLRGVSTTNPGFKDTVLTSVRVTYQAEDIWKRTQTEASYVIWRYIATTDGIVRMYPGVRITKDYDPKLRPWYRRTLAHKGKKYVISAPYKDAWGSGYLITLAQTVFEGKSDGQHSGTDKVAAVMGTDFPIYYFYQLLVKRYPVCNTEYRCFVIDTSGFIVIHPDFTEKYTDPELDKVYHITNKEGDIARDLMSKGILTKRTCLDYDNKKDQLTFRVELTILHANGVELSETNLYEMRAVEDSNVFIIIKKTNLLSTPCCAQQLSPRTVLCNNEASTCECLCYRDIEFDYCRNEYISSDASPPCSAATPEYEGVFKDEEKKIEGLQSCFETRCHERMSTSSCYEVAGCSWCSETADGLKAKPPFCALKECCEFGRIADDSDTDCKARPIVNGTTAAPPVIDVNVLPIVLGISLGSITAIVLIVLIIYAVRRKSRKRPNNDYLTAISVMRGTGNSQDGSYPNINSEENFNDNSGYEKSEHSLPPPYLPRSHSLPAQGSGGSDHYDKMPTPNVHKQTTDNNFSAVF